MEQTTKGFKVYTTGCFALIIIPIFLYIITPKYDVIGSMSVEDAMLADKIADWTVYIVIFGCIYALYGAIMTLYYGNYKRQ
jgi:hypothetical protein